MAAMNGAGVPSIKLEDGGEPEIKSEPHVKGESPSGYSDDDGLDDAGDLDFSKQHSGDIWLARLPKFLWENWDKLDDDQEVQIGSMRIEQEKNAEGMGHGELKVICSL